MSKIHSITGRAVAVRGNDIDTDRIIPARYLKTITFEGLDQHLFEDDRKELSTRGQTHPIDQPQHQGASIMIGEDNFGCGSSREHAPQAIARWGIKAIIATSYAEIFAGNSVMIGLVCVTATPDVITRLAAFADAHPDVAITLDLQAKTVTAGGDVLPVTMPESARSSFLSGNWDATSLLVADYAQVEAFASRLPYLGWAARRA